MTSPFSPTLSAHSPTRASVLRKQRSYWPALRRRAGDFVFLFPALAIFLTFVIFPSLSSFYYSLTNWNGLNNDPQFVGLQNFSQLFSTPELLTGTKVTLIFAAATTILQNGIALLLALALNRFLRLFTIFRVLFLLPALLSGLAIGYIWSYMYSPLFGFINILLTSLHLEYWGQDWLGDARFALPSIILTNTWQWVGFSMIIFLAGLQTVPQEMYEAANMDGAHAWQRFRFVTFPLIAPAFTVNIVLTLISCLKVFDIIFVMTEGGPGGATESWAFQLYREAFSQNHFGYATAMGIAMSLIILTIAVISLRLLRGREVEY